MVVLIHVLELATSTNTGRLAHLALSGSELRVRGERDRRTELDDLFTADREVLLLYPSLDSIELTPEFVASLKRPATLVVPDGSWRQASKVQTREPGLAAAKRVRLPSGQKPSEFRLRREPNPEAVCTMEAIARALGILEAERGPEVQRQLEFLLQTMVHRTLYSRGICKLEELERLGYI